MIFTKLEKIEGTCRQHTHMNVKDALLREFLREEEKKKKWTFTLIGSVHVTFPHLERWYFINKFSKTTWNFGEKHGWHRFSISRR